MDTPPVTLATTRRALHGVAELVLAGPQHHTESTVRLRVVPDGFATTVGEDVRLVGTAVQRGGTTVPVDGATPLSLATELGLRARRLDDVYPGGSDVRVDEVLRVDGAAAATLADAWSAGELSLRRLDPAQQPVLWPEHFDVGITVDRVNYGVSPGDAAIDTPYAYVGPWTLPPRDDFWTASFGAVLLLTESTGPDEVLAFFEEGRRRAR